MLLRKHIEKQLFFFAAMTLFSLALRSEVYAKFSLKSQWQRIETKHTIIQYQTLEDLKDFDSNIDYSPEGFSFGNLFSAGDSDNPAGSLTKKLDSLYERVQQILDMRGILKKVRINIYPNRTSLHEAYLSITGQECRVRAWYMFEVNTIYINKDDVDEGIIAHEMAHSIIDHYFSVRPPSATAEILATYVDLHLED
jgi:hypothetical protein